MTESDDLLIKLCLEGDKEAFGFLVKKYQNAVYNLCYHIIGNFADAEDLAQDVFVKAYLNLAKIREPSKFAGWLYRIAMNICKMWLRAKKAVSIIPFEDIIQNEDDTSPDKLVEVEETNNSIRKALPAVKNRLLRARRQLKKELIPMMESSFCRHEVDKGFTENVASTCIESCGSRILSNGHKKR